MLLNPDPHTPAPYELALLLRWQCDREAHHRPRRLGRELVDDGEKLRRPVPHEVFENLMQHGDACHHLAFHRRIGKHPPRHSLLIRVLRIQEHPAENKVARRSKAASAARSPVTFSSLVAPLPQCPRAFLIRSRMPSTLPQSITSVLRRFAKRFSTRFFIHTSRFVAITASNRFMYSSRCSSEVHGVWLFHHVIISSGNAECCS